MKYNWSAVAEELKKILVENTKIFQHEHDTEPDAGWVFHFKTELSQTDRFHPFGSDQELCKALEQLPTYCDYRRVEKFWNYKSKKIIVEDAVYNCLAEMANALEEYYSDKWNFPPATKIPAKVFIDDGMHLHSVTRILRAAKQKSK
jgi:hypothetical protein